MLHKLGFSLPLFAGLWAIFLPTAALAYVGPGAGLSVLGALFALLAAIALAVVGFVWYPVKRLLLRRRGGGDDLRSGTSQTGK